MPIKFLTVTRNFIPAIAFLCMATPVYAGFEWVSPNASSTGLGGPAYQPAPVTADPGAPSAATTMPEVISPVIISGTSGNGHILPQTYAAPSAMATVTASATHDVAPSVAPTSEAPDTEVVQGFASQVPLPLALRQILPAGYNFYIDQGVDMNMLVSYKGGKHGAIL